MRRGIRCGVQKSQKILKYGKRKKKEADAMKKMIVILLAVVLVLSLAACGQGGSAQNEIKTEIDAEFDCDGNAYVPLMSGKTVKIDDDVAEARITPDRTSIVVRTKDGILYFTDADQKKKTQITDDVEYIIAVRDAGILYLDPNGDCHRYLFADGSDWNVGSIGEYGLSETGFNTAFEIGSSVRIIPENSKFSIGVGGVKNYCDLLYLSDDGETVYWQDYNLDGEVTVYVSINGEETKLGTFETSSISTEVTYNKNHKFAVVTNSGADTLFVVPSYGEPLKVKLGSELVSNVVFTKTGLLSEDTSAAFSGIYVCVEGSEGNNLYYIDANGEREKVMSGIGAYAIYDNSICFVDEDDNLRIAKLAEETLSKEEKITGHVDILNYSTRISTGGYVYFIKDYDDTDETGTLYAYKIGSDPIRIASEVTCEKYGSRGIGYIWGRYGSDGKTIYYYKDFTHIDDAYGDYAVMYKYTYNDSEPTRIASDVIVGSISSGYTSRAINNKSFVYIKYYSVKNEKVIGDWYYYNGKESVRMASDIIY